MVLAYSLRRDALPELENLRNHDDPARARTPSAPSTP
jgi:hypothetical protein